MKFLVSCACVECVGQGIRCIWVLVMTTFYYASQKVSFTPCLAAMYGR